MAVLAYTIGFNALIWMNTDMHRLIIIYFEVPEDQAFISSRSHFIFAVDTAEILV